MGIFNFLSESKPKSDLPYILNVDFHPIRLPANKADYVEMSIDVTNNTGKEELMSVLISVPKGLGFDQSALSQEKELRLETMKPGEHRRFVIKLWSTQRTQKGSYNVNISVAGHYRTYKHVLSEVRRTIALRVV